VNWCWQGKAWVFGDDISNDDGIMPLAMTRQQEYDPAVLAKHCFEQIDPEFAREAKPCDIVVAGRNFGHGNPHIQGFLGLKGLGVGLIIGTMGRGPLRACINAGVPLMQAEGLAGFCITGDLLQVDFATGLISNQTTGAVLQAEPMPAAMREIVSAGGGIGHMAQRLGLGGTKE
jgi:3-isopropylmalate/(R)-2-methylmalate dehydratase small subunit